MGLGRIHVCCLVIMSVEGVAVYLGLRVEMFELRCCSPKKKHCTQKPSVINYCQYLLLCISINVIVI